MRNETCMFTGHRIIPISKKDALYSLLNKTVRELAERGCTRFICGGALGFDTMAAQAIIELKKEIPEIVLQLYLPCQDQDKYWSEHDRIQYCAIRDVADSVQYISEHYNRYCMHQRNRKMVDDAGTCIAFLEKETGGTAYTVKYARLNQLEVINLNDAL